MTRRLSFDHATESPRGGNCPRGGQICPTLPSDRQSVRCRSPQTIGLWGQFRSPRHIKPTCNVLKTLAGGSRFWCWF